MIELKSLLMKNAWKPGFTMNRKAVVIKKLTVVWPVVREEGHGNSGDPSCRADMGQEQMAAIVCVR